MSKYGESTYSNGPDPKKADLVAGKVPLAQLPDVFTEGIPTVSDLRSNGAAAASNAIAGPDQLVTGSDPRMGMPGGVQITAGAFEQNNIGTLTTECEVMWFGVPAAGSFCNVRSNEGSRNGAEVTGGQVKLVVLNATQDGISIPTTPTWFSFRMGPASQVLENLFTGETVAGAFGAVPENYRPEGWVNAFSGRVIKSHLFNRELTAGERLAVMRGETPPELAQRAFVSWPTTGTLVDGFVWANPTITKSWSGRTLSMTGGAFAGCYCAAPQNGTAGQRVRITGNVTATSGAYLTFRMLSGGSNVYVFSGVANTTGEFAIDAIAPADFSDVGVRFETADAANSVTINNLDVSVEGTVEAFDADKVTALNRWRGRFGTSLIPSGGVTALAPEPVQRREVNFVFDLTVPQFYDIPAGWTASKGGTGNINIGVPGYARANRAAITSRVNIGFASVTHYPANTFVDLANTGGTPADTGGTVTVSWEE